MTVHILVRNGRDPNVEMVAEEIGKTARRVEVEKLGNIKETDWLIRWGCTARIRNDKVKVINKKDAIRETTDKGKFRFKVAKEGLAPKTWLNIFDYLAEYEEPNQFVPLIVRPSVHERSENLHFCGKIGELAEVVKKLGNDVYISEYIAKQKEYRVFVANGRAMIVAEKMPKDRKEITWGCVEEGVLEYVPWSEWPNEVVECAIKSFNLSHLDFGAVDIMWKDGKAYFLEVNTAPEVWRYYSECFGLVFNYMIANAKGRDRIPIKDFTHWKNTIHPAISKQAVV
jgi:glutathione synthase/RimK-type ligase-like ATP-grasp enzyme